MTGDQDPPLAWPISRADFAFVRLLPRE